MTVGSRGKIVVRYDKHSLSNLPFGCQACHRKKKKIKIYLTERSSCLCVLVSVSVFMALSTVFHSINSPYDSLLSHSVLVVLFLPYWAFQLFISLSLSPDMILSG